MNVMAVALSNASRFLRRRLGAVASGMTAADRFARVMRTARGGITPEEGHALADAARAVRRGVIVEIGSFRGKSAVALAHGVADTDRPVYCIDPHEPFTGVLGGRFGPEDRAAFYRSMLETGAYRQVRLINLPAAQVAEGWHEPIGLLFIDGDHRYEAVREDFERWYPHVLAGGVIAFDDTHLSDLGPSVLLGEILPDRCLRRVGKVGKITFVEKLAHLTPRPHDRRRFLVVCQEMQASGGLLRFERVGRELAGRGDRLAFLRLGDGSRTEFRSRFPLLTLAEAASQRWDATLVPGQGFPPDTIERLAELVGPRFGQRVQHVLNDATRRDGFLAVNRSFRPHAVVFNNRHWEPGSYTDFAADRFATIEGAVDVARFAPATATEHDGFHVGGVSKPQLRAFWSDLAARMPAHWTLHLFGADPELGSETRAGARVDFVGRLSDAELPAFYRRLDAVVHAESYAGWANVVAEAMAAGVPVVCTPAGTLALAEHDRTARVIDATSPDELCTRALAELAAIETDPAGARAMAARATEHVRSFGWSDYTERLRAICVDDGRSHYTLAPELGLYGKWPLAGRLEGLHGVLARMQGATVLDLGCAEGVVARACFDHGADAVHGFELDASRVATSLEINQQPRACFVPASLVPWDSFVAQQPTLRKAYDVVLYLGIHHHLPVAERGKVLAGALARCRSWFVVRTPAAVWDSDGIDAAIRAAGFEPIELSEPSLAAQGRLGCYRRITPDPALSQRDLRFVSFPKSGRSWIRFALTQLGVADRITFEHDGFEYNDGSKPALDFDAGARWQKCHRADRVVYMSRDPRDAIVSLFHQVTGRFKDFFGYRGDLGAFVRDPYFGAENLAGFQRMWRRVVRAGLAEHVTYEQAHADFEATLVRVLEAFGLECSAAAVRAASEAARFSNMKSVEASGQFAEPWLRPRNEAPKVRRGEVGAFRSELGAADQAWLDQVFADLLA